MRSARAADWRFVRIDPDFNGIPRVAVARRADL